jgi:DNA-binding protein HU-beta
VNKSELVNSISNSTDITKVAAEKVLDCFMQSIETTLKNDGKVVLVGFGTFLVSKRSARKGRNPQTGKEIQIPAKKIPKFKAGSKLSEVVN